jgi:hypothetical protein
MRKAATPLVLVAALAGCASAPRPLPAERFTVHLPSSVERDHANLAKSWRTIESACLAEEKRLLEARDAAASKRRTTEAILAGAAGGLALGAAVYSGLADPGPNAFVIVPLTGGAAAAAAPLTVMLLSDGDDEAALERVRRIEDRRDLARLAYAKLLEAERDLNAEGAAASGADQNADAQRLGAIARELEEASRALESAEHAAPRAPVQSTTKPGKEDKSSAPPAPALDGDLASARRAGERARSAIEAMRVASGDDAARALREARVRRVEAALGLDSALERLGDVCGRSGP